LSDASPNMPNELVTQYLTKLTLNLIIFFLAKRVGHDQSSRPLTDSTVSLYMNFTLPEL